MKVLSDDEKKIREARNKYYREYYKNPANKQKKKDAQKRYWLKKALEG